MVSSSAAAFSTTDKNMSPSSEADDSGLLDDYFEKGLALYDFLVSEDTEEGSAKLKNGKRRPLGTDVFLARMNNYGSDYLYTNNWTGQDFSTTVACLGSENSISFYPPPSVVGRQSDFVTSLGSKNPTSFCTAPSVERRRSDFETMEEFDILQFGKTSLGALSLGKVFSSGSSRVERKRIFSMVMKNVLELIIDQFGNQLLIEVIEYCNENELNQILNSLTAKPGPLYSACSDLYGSKAIKQLITILAGSPLVSYLITGLCKVMKQIMNNRTAASIVMQCIETLDSRQNQMIYEAVIENFVSIVSNTTGCISFNQLIGSDHCSYKQQLLDLVCEYAVFLSKDPSANFVLQQALDLQNPELTNIICLNLRGHFVDLSTMQGGSRVVEKILKLKGMSPYVAADILGIKDKNLMRIAGHKFGNFVVQAVLKATKTEDRIRHASLVKRLSGLRGLQYGFGKNVYYLLMEGVTV